MKNKKMEKYINLDFKKTPLRIENTTLYRIKSFLKSVIILGSCVGIYLTSSTLYVLYNNKAQNLTNDFDTDKVIDDNGNEIEVDDNGQINPYPVSDEEKQQVISKYKQFLSNEAKNFGITDVINKIISVDCIQIREQIIEDTYKNYLITIKFETTDKKNNSNTYELQYYADKDFSLTTTDQSDVNKLNELINYLQNPDYCALYNLNQMSELSKEIMDILINRGNKDISFVGQSIKTQHNSGDTLYLIPVYHTDGKIDVWTTSIQSTQDLEFEFGSWYEDQLAPEKAFIEQLAGKDEYFTKTEKSSGSSLTEINSILQEYQDSNKDAEEDEKEQAQNQKKEYNFYIYIDKFYSEIIEK